MVPTITLESMLEEIIQRCVRREIQKMPNRPGELDELYTSAQVGTALGVPKSWIERQARHGPLKVTKLGHYVRFKAQDVKAFIEGNGGAVERARRRA